MSKKREMYHIVDKHLDETLLENCETGEEIVSKPLESGKPIPPGAALANFRKSRDGVHLIKEDIVLSGPPQVSTPAYRDGWEETFGKNGVN